MTKIRVLASLCALALGIVTPAQASEAVGTVAVLAVRSADGLHYVVVNGSRSVKPACATYEYFMITDEHSDAGKAQLAMLLSAYMSGKVVHVSGSGICGRWGDGEDIMMVTLAN